MPIMNGLESTRCIRDPQSEYYNPDIPIVAMTANAMKGDKESWLEVGMNDYIPKPINHEVIKQTLEKLLNTKYT